MLPLLFIVLFDPRIPLAFRSFYGNVLVFKFADKMNTSYFYTTFPAIAFLIVSEKHPRTSTHRALTSAGELGTMSKNNLRGITFGIRPIWGIRSLTSYSLGYEHYKNAIKKGVTVLVFVDGYYSKYMTHESYIRNPSNPKRELSFLEKKNILN